MKRTRLFYMSAMAGIMALMSSCATQEPNNPIPKYIHCASVDLERSIQVEQLSRGYNEFGNFTAQLKLTNLTETTLSLKISTSFTDETGAEVDKTPAKSIVFRGGESQIFPISSISDKVKDFSMDIKYQ